MDWAISQLPLQILQLIFGRLINRPYRSLLNLKPWTWNFSNLNQDLIPVRELQQYRPEPEKPLDMPYNRPHSRQGTATIQPPFGWHFIILTIDLIPVRDWAIADRPYEFYNYGQLINRPYRSLLNLKLETLNFSNLNPTSAKKYFKRGFLGGFKGKSPLISIG